MLRRSALPCAIPGPGSTPGARLRRALTSLRIDTCEDWFNIAGGRPVELMSFISTIENKLGREAQLIMLPMQKGDVVQTMADPTLLRQLIGTIPETNLADGVGAFVDWYRRDMVRILRDIPM